MQTLKVKGSDKKRSHFLQKKTRLSELILSFLGNIGDAQNLDRLNQYGITHIINCTPDLPLHWEDKYEYKRVDILDSPSQNILKHFDSVFEFIGLF
jgi:hypothetical protein